MSLAALALVGLPATAFGLTSVDVGSTSGGSSSYNSGTGVYTITGAGADIWGYNDAFQFYYQTLTGDGTIIAKVLTVQNTSGWAKAGIMMRTDLTSSSAHAMVSSSPTGGGAASMMWRSSSGAAENATTDYYNPAPIWFKLVRAGNLLTGSYSPDGNTWTQIDSQTITMPTQVYVGLFECSNSVGTLGTATMSNVTINAATSVLTPFAWGSVAPSGSTGYMDHAGNMFNAQPSWNGTAPSAPADSNGNDYIAANWDHNGVAYIDLGAGWRTWRIQQCWTQYLVSRSSPVPATAVWWDSAPSSAPGGVNSYSETQINFDTKTNDGTGGWVQDANFTTPITPKGRYLMLQTGWAMADACEFAFIGSKDLSGTNYPPIVSAGTAQTIQWTANLTGTASDDGIPTPPGAMTYNWSMVSGPTGGVVNVTTPTSLTTTATFTKIGTYVLQLTASDSLLSSSSTVSIIAQQSSAPLTMPEVKAFDYSTLTLVDEVLCDGIHDAPGGTHPVIESTPGVSQVQTILGRSCRVLVPSPTSPPGYFGYTMAAGNKCVAGQPYILVVEYPEDKARTTMVINRGCETTRTFYTGAALGDSFTGPYVASNPSSMHFGLSQQSRTMEELFHLHNNFPGILEPRDAEYPRDQNAGTGFVVMVAQYSGPNVPMSAGAAASRIAIYAAPPNWTSYAQQVTLPPSNLPKRHLFWREEMSDGELGPRDGVSNDIDWYEWKAQLAKFLGMNTFSKHLLEFGYNQGFSSASYTVTGTGTSADGQFMFAEPAWSNRWEQIIYRLTGGSTQAPSGYGLDFMPYFEYCGSIDGYSDGYDLGTKKLAKPLIGINSGNDYTGVYWSETADVDVTDNASTLNPYTEGQQLMNCTMTSLTGATGGRPVAIDQPWNQDPNFSGAGAWGYVDFGSNWANYRITQTWTRSLGYDDPASPYTHLYWANSYSGFTGTNSTPPTGVGAVAETHINFMTQPLYGRESIWKRGMNMAVSAPIIPQGRYLVMQSPNPLSRPSQYVFVGWINGGSSTGLMTLPVAGAGPTEASAWPRHDIVSMFNNQPPFNAFPASFAGAWFRTRPTHIRARPG